MSTDDGRCVQHKWFPASLKVVSALGTVLIHTAGSTTIGVQYHTDGGCIESIIYSVHNTV